MQYIKLQAVDLQKKIISIYYKNWSPIWCRNLATEAWGEAPSSVYKVKYICARLVCKIKVYHQ